VRAGRKTLRQLEGEEEGRKKSSFWSGGSNCGLRGQEGGLNELRKGRGTGEGFYQYLKNAGMISLNVRGVRIVT